MSSTKQKEKKLIANTQLFIVIMKSTQWLFVYYTIRTSVVFYKGNYMVLKHLYKFTGTQKG